MIRQPCPADRVKLRSFQTSVLIVLELYIRLHIRWLSEARGMWRKKLIDCHLLERHLNIWKLRDIILQWPFNIKKTSNLVK